MVIVKANKDSEAGILPSKEILTEMGKFNEELVKAASCWPEKDSTASSKGARVRFSAVSAPLSTVPLLRPRS